MVQPHIELSRDLSLFDVTMIGVGAMVGAGIFVLTGIAAGTAGPALIFSFPLNGIITIFTALVYAELGSAILEAGGGYLWVKYGLPGPHAFLAGWMSWFAHAVAGSLYALGFGSYLGLVMSELGVSVPWIPPEYVNKIMAALIIGVFMFINMKGALETGIAGNIVTVMKILILLLFIGSGVAVILKNPTERLESYPLHRALRWSSVLKATGSALVCTVSSISSGGKLKNPTQHRQNNWKSRACSDRK